MTSHPRTRVFCPDPIWGCDRLVSRAKVIENQVMAAPVISISSNTSEESVGYHAPRVILFGVIPAIIPVIPEVPIVPADPIVTSEVGTVSVVSPAEVLDSVDYSPSSDSDPSEDSLPPAPYFPLFSPFLCFDDTEADNEFEPAEQRPVSLSHDTLAPLSEFPLAPVVASPGIRRRSAILVRPGEAIPFGRPYRTHLNRPRKLLTTRKRIRPILARRLAWRRVSHHSSDHHSSPDSSFSSEPSDHSLSRHTPPDTTDADSSTPWRFVHRSLARTPQHREAFRCWRSAPLSTPYPPTTSESSLGLSSERSLDSSSPSSRPSHKRCRTPTASVPSPTHVSRSIAPTPVDLLPPRKRFRDSYSSEDSGEEHIEMDTADAETVADVGISEGVVAHPEDGVGMGFDIAASNVREDDDEFEVEASAADTREIVVDPLVIEVRIDRITEIETTQRQLETSQMVASGERASLVERIGSLRLEYLKVRAMLSIEIDRIDSIHRHMALSQEEFRQVCRDRDDTRRRLRRLESKMTITRSGMTPEAIEELVNRRMEEALAAHEATRAANALEDENQSQERHKLRAMNYGNGGIEMDGNGDGREWGNRGMEIKENGVFGNDKVVWRKMETVFHISNCPEKSQVKYATCTLLNSALTWWNSHKRTIRTEAAFAMSWRELMKLMTKVYCPRNEIQKMESELWNLIVKNNDLAAYT
ncbi:reverse transcriptase domain-containing protein [Tanacetum coccineum]